MQFLIATCKKEFQSFQAIGLIHNDNRLRNMPFIINMQLINQNIKSSSNLEFEIKSQTLNMFQLNKKWENFVIKNNCCDQLLWF
jgi:hypothetical protein